MRNIDIIKILLISCTGIAICLLTALYVWDLIEIAFLENPQVKVIVSVIVSLFLILYLIYSPETKPLYLIGFSVLLEIIGGWWLKSGVGYVFIIAGIGLIVASFVITVRKDSWFEL